MYSHPKKLLIISFFSIVFIIGNISSLSAVNLPFINKPKIRISVPAGEQRFGELMVENPTTEERSMRLYFEDWYYISDGDGTKEFLPAGTLTRSCASWITFSPAEFTIPPFGKQRVSYSVRAPQNTSGGYYAALFFELLAGKFETTPGTAGAGINLTVRIASLFFVEVEGTVNKLGFVDNLTLRRDSSSGAILIGLDFMNGGNVDITAAGTFHIMDKQGMVYARGEFNNAYTFPGDSTKLTGTWKQLIPSGRYDLILTLDLGKAQEEVGLGRGPVIAKEAEILIGENNQILKVGRLR